MRIVIDLQGAQTESRFRGIGRYSTALAQAIARNAGDHEVWVILNCHFHEAIEAVRANFKGVIPAKRIVVFDIPPLVSWETPANAWRRRAAELVRESFISELRPDIVHVSSLFEGANLCNATLSVGTFESRVATAVTLYDLIPLLDPENYLGAGWVRDWYMDKVENLKRADLLLAISEHSRQEAMEHLGIDGDRIVNISSAHTNIFRPCNLDDTCKQALFSRYGITLPYLVYNGALESRKNLDRLLQAFSLLPPELRNLHQLVFVGKVSDYNVQRLHKLARELGIDKQFVLTGYVPDEDLAALFTYCALFVFPSLHEGFGLPALEAMACGAPTIGSNVTSIPEVIGRGDALFDPYNPNEIASKIVSVLTDEDLRRSLCEHGIAQASKFSWDFCAQRAIVAFERLHENRTLLKLSSLTEIAAEREHRDQRLINAIADIPRQPVAPSDADLMVTATCIASNQYRTDCIDRASELPEIITWRIEGPFDSSYSLALLNRETARALDTLGHRVILHSTEGPGDFPPNPDFLRANPDIAKLHARYQDLSYADAEVTSRNLYPPRVADMDCRMNLLHHYAWEESGFPLEWAESFNEHLQGLTCLSRHVEKIMVDHGVIVPMSVSGCGVDHWERIKPDESYRLEGCRSFRFLHVSSCFPRKGADLLLEAYGRAFTMGDDVTLVIKTFPNPHNEINQWLADARAGRNDYPDVLIIEEDLTDSQLKSLYGQCHAMVAPSRAEGFGLPMAEAMLSGLAVITTGWGGQLDFCNEETAWLVDYTFAPARTHFALHDSVWAEPDVEHLARTMRNVFDTAHSSREERAARGKQLLLERFRWSDVATRLVSSARAWAQTPAVPQPRVGWVTTWNTRCGIASYSAHLVMNMSIEPIIFANRAGQLSQLDGTEVERCWDSSEDESLEELAGCINNHKIDTLVVQFNYGFFNFEQFGRFLTEQLNMGRKVILILHSSTDQAALPHRKLTILKDVLVHCHRLLVHSQGDLNRLKNLGLVDNVALFPHGIPDFSPPSKIDSQPIAASTGENFTIVSYGFFLPHKGLLELIEAVALLRQAGQKVRLHMVNAEYPVPESAALIEKAKEKISKLTLGEHIKLTTDFLPDDECLSLLAEADLVVFPYQNTAESSSAAVRYGIAAGRPVAVTPLSIFDDVAHAVYTLPGCSPAQIALGISQLIQEIANGTESAGRKETEAMRWREAHRWSRVSQRLYGMLKQL